MAQDMGLNRNSAKFQEGSEALFKEAEKEIRNRIWWCALILDKWVSFLPFRHLKISSLCSGMFRVISGNQLSSSPVISTHRCQSSPTQNVARSGSRIIRGYGRLSMMSNPVLAIFLDLVVSFLALLTLEGSVSWKLARQATFVVLTSL